MLLFPQRALIYIGAAHRYTGMDSANWVGRLKIGFGGQRLAEGSDLASGAQIWFVGSRITTVDHGGEI